MMSCGGESYEDKYRKYKKLYLDTKYGRQYGGAFDSQDLQQFRNWLNTKFEGLKDYANIISKLESHCKQEVSNINDLKQKIQHLRNVSYENKIGEGLENLLNNLGQEFENLIGGRSKNLLSDQKINEIHKNVCHKILNDIIPRLEQQKRLQEDLVEKFKDVQTQGKININKYIEFAKNNDLLNDSVDTILNKYSQHIENFTKFINNEAKENKSLMEKLSGKITGYMKPLIETKLPKQSTKSMLPATMATSTALNIPGFISGIYGKSEGDRTCIGPCEERHDSLRGDYHTCKTEKYDFLYKKYNWDYCDPKKILDR